MKMKIARCIPKIGNKLALKSFRSGGNKSKIQQLLATPELTKPYKVNSSGQCLIGTRAHSSKIINENQKNAKAKLSVKVVKGILENISKVQQSPSFKSTIL